MTAVSGELERFARGGVGVGDNAGRARSGGVGRAPSGGSLYVDCQRIWGRLTLAESPIRDGCVISLGSPDGCVVPEPSGLVDILVAGGPDAGVIHRIGPGRADIGSGAAAISIGDPAVPSRALLVCVDERGGCQVAAYPGVAATLDRAQLGGPVPWRPGQLVAIGGTLLGLAAYAPSDAGAAAVGGRGRGWTSAGRRGHRGPVALASVSGPVPLAAPVAAPGGRAVGGAAGRRGAGRRGRTGRAGRRRRIGARCRCWRRGCRWWSGWRWRSGCTMCICWRWPG